MTPFWITFEKGPPACVEAKDEKAAMEIAEKERQVKPTRAQLLPYPATPRLGPQSDCPAFCYSPRECVGRGSCPKSYACSE